MLWNFEITYVYTLDDYMVLTLKKWLYKKSDHRIINELNYIISVQRVAVAHVGVRSPEDNELQ
jgi:hypothetical protein